MPDTTYQVVTSVTIEPIILSDAKTYCRVDYTDEDSLIIQLITDARLYGERLTRYALATQTVQAILTPPAMPAGPLYGPVIGPGDPWMAAERPNVPLFGDIQVAFKLPLSPVQSMITVEYQLTKMDQPEWQTLPATDINNNPNYRLDQIANPSELNIFTVVSASRYQLTYVTGYTTIPVSVRRALFSLISFWFNNREGQGVPEDINSQFLEAKSWEF